MKRYARILAIAVMFVVAVVLIFGTTAVLAQRTPPVRYAPPTPTPHYVCAVFNGQTTCYVPGDPNATPTIIGSPIACPPTGNCPPTPTPPPGLP